MHKIQLAYRRAGEHKRYDQVLPKRLSGEGVGIVIKRYVEGLGFDPSQFAAAAGKSERAILQQTGHRSVNTVRRYIRDGVSFANFYGGRLVG
jgi:hypothetical protein